MTNLANGTRAVERALEIIECFTEENYELGISDIAKKVALSKATTYRIIKTMEAKGYVVQEPVTQKYRLGPRVLRLSSLFLTGLDFRRIALPYMHKVRDLLNESVNLFIASGMNRICIERIECTQPLRRVLKVGDSFPLERGAAGKVLLAFGAGTGQAGDANELAVIRRQGYAVTHGDRADGASSVAAPIFDHRGEIVAAFAISGPTARYQEPMLKEYISVVVENAKATSRDLGYQK